jgi:hypothetical protein
LKIINLTKDWDDKQKNLKVLLPNQKTFVKGIDLLLEMHSILHDKKVYKLTSETIYDNLLENLKEETCKITSNIDLTGKQSGIGNKASLKNTSILWNIWHITRIEDIISNILIGNKETIFNKEIQEKLCVKITDTGNAMTYSEVESFNKNINIKELKEYRIKVGKSTKKIIETFEFNDLKRGLFRLSYG